MVLGREQNLSQFPPWQPWRLCLLDPPKREQSLLQVIRALEEKKNARSVPQSSSKIVESSSLWSVASYWQARKKNIGRLRQINQKIWREKRIEWKDKKREFLRRNLSGTKRHPTSINVHVRSHPRRARINTKDRRREVHDDLGQKQEGGEDRD